MVQIKPYSAKKWARSGQSPKEERMDIKPEDMTLELCIDNIRIGISNTKIALSNAERELQRLENSYKVVRDFIKVKTA